MHLIKLDATGSTNLHLKKLWQDGSPIDWTVVWTANQHSGRGQQGSIWHSEAGKNLTFSVLKYFKNFDIRHQFRLNMAVSLAVFEALQQMDVPQIRVKWPNDILSGTEKISGILIENIVKAKERKATVIGIGLN
ncbi:MAG: biotin--[acetyl-CoA-carboxylase] ligase, partial [Flavobacteriaceae bacterium]